MKRILPVLLLLSILFCACQSTSDVPAGMLRASDGIVDYELFVPDDWTVDQTGGAVAAYKSTSDPLSVSVMVWNLPHTDTSISDWWDTYRAEFDMIFTDFTEEGRESTLLDGEAAEKLVYTAKLGDTSYRYTQIASIRRGSIYLMTFTEHADSDLAAHAEEISEISTMFRWR